MLVVPSLKKHWSIESGSKIGLLRGTFRVASYTARTGIRAGSSIASGRVPSLSIGVGLGGFGARIGTRGVSIRTPIAAQSIGAQGLTSTIRLPGIASVSVNPIRPSAAARLGPIRVRAAKNPSVRIGTPLLSLGLSTHPLLTANIGPISLNIPGRMSRPSRPWSEEVDDQWRPYYERRPPSISEQLHVLIQQVERDAKSSLSPIDLDFECPQVPLEPITSKQRRAARREIRKGEMKALSIFSLKRRSAARVRIKQLLADWSEAEMATRLRTQSDLQERVRVTYDEWKAGDQFVSTLVFQTLAQVLDLPAFIISAEKARIRLAVFGPRIEDIHPLGPSWTPSGNPTVKKRTKKERDSIWADICGAQITRVGQIGKSAFKRDVELEILTVLPSNVSEFGQLAVVARATLPISKAGFPSGRQAFRNGILIRPQRAARIDRSLESTNASALAIGISVTSIAELATPSYWIQANGLIEEITRTGRRHTSKSQNSLKHHGNSVITESSVPELLTQIERLRNMDSAELIANDELLTSTIAVMESLHASNLDREMVGEYLVSLAEIASRLSDQESLRRIEILATLHSFNQQERAEIHSLILGNGVSQFESELTHSLARLRNAIDEGDLKSICNTCIRFVAQLPEVPLGADDEAEELGWVLIEFLAIAGYRDLLELIERSILKSSKAIQTRFSSIMESGIETLLLTETIIGHLARNPGFQQSELADALSLQKPRVRKVCWYLNHFGYIERLATGRSYRLWLSDDQSWPLPL